MSAKKMPPAETRPDDAAYEAPDPERTATASPTEGELERESPVGTSAVHDPYAALRFREYRLFSLGWMISVIGFQMLSTAIGWEIFDRTGSKLALGWVAGIQALPLIVLALPAGQLADWFDRRRIIVISSSAAAACSLAMAALSYRPGSIPFMYGTLLLYSAALTLGRPARSSFLPQIVPPPVFSNAVTWNSSFFQISSMLGPALGGLVMLHSVRTAYALDALCALTFAAITFSLPPPRFGAGPGRRQGRVLANLAAGIQFVWRTKIILATLTLDLFAVLLGGAVYLLPVFAKDILRVGSVGYGWLRAAEAIGALSMAMAIAHLPPMKNAGRAMLLAVAAFGAATIVFGLSRSFWLSFAMVFLIGAFDNISVVVRHTLVQVLTPDAMRGRVSAVNNIFIGASNELGGLESGLTAAWWGPVASVVAGGIGTIAVVIATALAWPQLRRFGSLQDARPAQQPAS